MAIRRGREVGGSATSAKPSRRAAASVRLAAAVAAPVVPLVWALVASMCAGCAHAREAPSTPEPGPESAASGSPATNHDPPAPREEVQVGYATWYGRAFAGKRTASGERFDPRQLTAAHRTLPFGTWVEVKRVDTGATVRVRITDRGPWGHEDRIIDLSQEAAKQIGFGKVGLLRVEVRVVPGP